MVRPKPTSSKKSKNRGGVDFKKIKRKIGRKLPPPKNATNTQVKSKAIVLPEQSVASERAGFAVSRKGLTLKELLQQTSHHNAKVRKDALLGIRDLAIKYPEELRLHILATIEKLRERISDDDKVVRETLYQLLKSVIFPATKEEIPGPIISLMMAYVFNAMTHIAIHIRLMAFKFFDLVVLHYPSSFFSYAEKVLHNYEDILQNSQTYLQEKSNLKTALGGLVRCLSLLACDGKKVDPSDDQVPNVWGALHAYEPELKQQHAGFSSNTKKLEDLLTVLVNCFQEFVPLVCYIPTVETQSFDCMQCILQSINLIVKIFSGEINKLHATYGVSIPSPCRPDETLWGDSSMPLKLKKLFKAFPLFPVHQSAEKEDRRYLALNVGITEIFLHLNDCLGSPAILLEKFLGFIEHILSLQISDPRSNKLLLEKHSISLVPFVPRLATQALGSWRSRLLEAFTKAFMACKPDSTLNLVCLSAIEEMLLSTRRQGTVVLDVIGPDFTGYHVIWMRRLPELLLSLGDRQPSATKVILQLLLHLGHYAPMNSALIEEYDNMQCLFREFYGMHLAEVKDQGSGWHGPFVRLPKDCQELAISCLYYFSMLDPRLLESLAWCCLCDSLKPDVILRIIEILHSAYKAGHLQITDHISFLITLLARFKVFPEKAYSGAENEEKISNRGSFKAIADSVCSCISQMGDSDVVLKILQKTILNEMSLDLSLDNKCAILRMFIMLDSVPPRLSEENIVTFSSSLCHYLMAAAAYIPDNDDEITGSDYQRIFRYYAQPAIFLFYRNEKLLSLVLNGLRSSIMELHPTFPSDCSKRYSYELLSRVNVIICILLFMLKDFELKPSLASCKEDLKQLLQNILKLQTSKETDMTLQERHKIQQAFDQLMLETDRSHLWDADDFKSILEVGFININFTS